MKWRVSPTVQSLLDKIDHDWNIPFSSMSPEIPNIYLQDSLFLDDTSLYSKIGVPTWNWQEKSKCFPLIKTTKAPISSCQHRQAPLKNGSEKKAQYSRHIIQKIALFDTSSANTGQARQRTRNHPDYGKEIAPHNHHGSDTTDAKATITNGSNKQVDTTAVGIAACSFLPHREIDSFIKRKQQRNNSKQEDHRP
ncbi:hypothetical protein BD408DRAFT_415492 [Parasitella parasitica]|nr:hypothetical protein BD408DRAFT_415492 [Parasitella parasitica]